MHQTHFNELTPAELERLAILMEECAEVIYIGGKILRHGYNSFHPSNPESINRNELNKELGQLANIIAMMVQADDLDVELMESAADEKYETMQQWLHHQE